MRHAFTMIPFTLLALIWAGGAQAQPSAPASNCGPLERIAELPLIMTDGSLQVPVTIGGMTRNFTLSLSNSLPQLSREFADALKVKLRVNREAYFVGGEWADATTAPTDIALGRVQIAGVLFLVVPTKVYKQGQAGEIPLSMLRNLDVEIDFARAKATIFSPEHCPGQGVYWTGDKPAALSLDHSSRSNFVFVPMTLDGHAVRAALGGASRITSATLRDLFGLTLDAPGMQKVTPAEVGDEPLPYGRSYYSYDFQSLNAGGLSVLHPKIYIAESKPGAGRCTGASPANALQASHPAATIGFDCESSGGDLAVGLTILTKLHLYFANTENILYVTAASAH